MERPLEVKLPEFSGGLNTNDPEYSIYDNQSPDLLNMWFKDLALCKRPGQSLVTELSNTYRVSNPYNGYRVVHAGTKLYKWDGEATQIATGIQNSAGTFCEFGDTMYYIDGVEIWQITSSFVVSAVTPYIPVVLINTAPDRSSATDNEAYNLIGAGFTVWYNPNGTATTYQLPQTNLDATAVVVTVNGTSKTENTHFTVNRTAGTVNFAAGTSPIGAVTAGTNTVTITAYKTITGSKAKIAKCKIAIPFGGEAAGVTGGTRVVVMGNTDHPYYYWKSDLGMHVSYGMTYFPDTFEEVLDQNSEAITAAAKMGDKLVILKEESIFSVGYLFDGKDAYYPVAQLHDAIGCDMPGSVQLIDNRLVFAHSSSGVHAIVSINNANELTVKPLSANINKLLLKESNLSSACSADFDQYYWLCVNGKVYLWDYGKTPYRNYNDYDEAQRKLSWYRWSGINATQFFSDTELYFGGETGIVKFTSNKNDFGAAYPAYFKTKAFDLGKPNVEKSLLGLWPTFSTDGNILTTVTVANEKKDEYKSATFDIRSFDLSEINLAAFTLRRIKFAEPFYMKVNMKKSVYIQVVVSGDVVNRGVGLSGMRFNYVITREIKKRG